MIDLNVCLCQLVTKNRPSIAQNETMEIEKSVSAGTYGTLSYGETRTGSVLLNTLRQYLFVPVTM